ncbi:unnamed protein product [Miscanthus lutarioriparius]|uniref:Uncharacterized protein n=1 Tax=Miscanthus lutarioriparius TaxID=422564 RepID=A0A811RF65_9POAL|nr:unnamed protein product [Miscanthus lutarioriparius]
MLLGPVLQSPELLQPVLKLEPPVFLKMLVFLEELLQSVLKLEPPVFLKMLVFLKLVLLKLVLFPLVHGGQRHLLVKENFHFVGAAMGQSSMSPIDLGARRTPSPAQKTDDLVDDVDVEETETINVDENFRTDRRLNWSVDEDKRLCCYWSCCRQVFLALVLLQQCSLNYFLHENYLYKLASRRMIFSDEVLKLTHFNFCFFGAPAIVGDNTPSDGVPKQQEVMQHLCQPLCILLVFSMRMNNPMDSDSLQEQLLSGDRRKAVAMRQHLFS